MGNCSEACAKEFNFKREELDEYAINSFNKAKQVQYIKSYNVEIVKVNISSKANETVTEMDEGPSKGNYES